MRFIMKRIMLFFVVLLAGEAFAMELPPTFTPAKTPEDKKSLYQDPKANDEFVSKIQEIILSSLKDDKCDKKLFEELKQYACNHTVDAEVFWKFNKGRTLAEAKAVRDHARLRANKYYNNHGIFSDQVSPILFRTNLNIGYLNDFKGIIASVKRLQNPEKK